MAQKSAKRRRFKGTGENQGFSPCREYINIFINFSNKYLYSCYFTSN